MKLVLGAQLADAFTLLLAIAVYGAATIEANPLVRSVYLASGILGLLLVKGLVAGGIALGRRWVPERAGVLRVAGVTFGLLGVASNLVAVWMLS